MDSIQGTCGKPAWQGDGYCDDNNNNAGYASRSSFSKVCTCDVCLFIAIGVADATGMVATAVAATSPFARSANAWTALSSALVSARRMLGRVMATVTMATTFVVATGTAATAVALMARICSIVTAIAASASTLTPAARFVDSVSWLTLSLRGI